MSYKINWCSEEEFERLPYKKVETSVGLYDKKTGEVFVRQTGNPAMDIFTVYHELEHVKGDDLGEHEDPSEPGVFYKNFGSTMKAAAPIASFIPGVGPFLSAGMGIGGSFMDAKYQAKQAKQANQMQPQGQGVMGQFNPAMSMPQNAAPATSQVGGSGTGSIGGLMSGTIAKLRDLMNQRQSGFYSGRDAGGYV